MPTLTNKFPKLLIVSNRLPVSVAKKGGKLVFTKSDGGLATGLSSLNKIDKLWVGWPGIPSDNLTSSERRQIVSELKKHHCFPVFLTESQVNDFYFGYSNTTLWPLFHYFTQHTEYQARFRVAYTEVNKLFANAVGSYVKKDTAIWVHDYQLMLLPSLIRERFPNSTIGFFLHIPFPSFEIFRLLPSRADMLRGLLGADLIGFHTYDYTRHFLSSVLRILGHKDDLGVIHLKKRIIRADAFPIGIDYSKFAQAAKKPKVQTEIKALKKHLKGVKLILSLDRVDYSKGILERLKAYDQFLSKNPDYLGKVTMVMIAIPSRMKVAAYKSLRREIEITVSRINGKYSQVGWSPISYYYRSIPFQQLIALYSQADVALITPLRDGMNLVAKEYVATKQDGNGVLILSEMTGAASELPEAIIVNPNHREVVSTAIKDALTMPLGERKQRMKLMQGRIQSYDVRKWAKDFIQQLQATKTSQKSRLQRDFTKSEQNKLRKAYKKSKKSLLLLDYDGTLVDFTVDPSKSVPPDELQDVIKKLAIAKNTTVIISGRPKKTLDKWFGRLPVQLVAEHGGWIKTGKVWQQQARGFETWKKTLRPLLDYYVDRTAGSFVEEKDFALVWHYRKVPPSLAGVRKKELRHDIQQKIKNSDIGLFEGSKIFEIKPKNINKGFVAKQLFDQSKWDFVLAIGDDYTDEDMFDALPKSAYTIKVGFDESASRFHVSSPEEVLKLLTDLSRQ